MLCGSTEMQACKRVQSCPQSSSQKNLALHFGGRVETGDTREPGEGRQRFEDSRMVRTRLGIKNSRLRVPSRSPVQKALEWGTESRSTWTCPGSTFLSRKPFVCGIIIMPLLFFFFLPSFLQLLPCSGDKTTSLGIIWMAHCPSFSPSLCGSV